MESENLCTPPLNIDICLKIANNDKTIARKLISMFVKDLPSSQQEINTSFKNNDIISLKKQIHKLLGASAYCGAEDIQSTLNALSIYIKDNNKDGIEKTVALLNENIRTVMDFYREGTLI